MRNGGRSHQSRARLASGIIGVVIDHGERGLLHPIIRALFDFKTAKVVTPLPPVGLDQIGAALPEAHHVVTAYEQASDFDVIHDHTTVGPAVEYKGYSIQPLAMRQASGFLTAGLISRDADGKRREHRFVRADTHPSADDAREFTILKAQRLIDEQGERLFGREDGPSA